MVAGDETTLCWSIKSISHNRAKPLLYKNRLSISLLPSLCHRNSAAIDTVPLNHWAEMLPSPPVFFECCTLQKIRSLVSNLHKTSILEPKQRKWHAKNSNQLYISLYLYLWSVESPVCACNLRGAVAQIITPSINNLSLISECITCEK